MGLTFVLDRDSGQPIFPVQDVPTPRSDVPGEEPSPTQPIPLLPRPLVRQAITEADLTNITPEAHAHALQLFRRYRSGSIYTPPSLQGTITMPGHLGGAQWHGGSFDPQLNVLYVNVNEAPTINKLRPVSGPVSPGGAPGGRGNPGQLQLGRQVYEANCMQCHGAERTGNPPLIPGLAGLDLSRPEHRAVIQSGRNAMPGYRQLRAAELDALAAYNNSSAVTGPGGSSTARRFSVDGYIQFNDAEGFPAISPPWGTLNAIDMVTGNILWKAPLGEYPKLAAKGIRNTGTMNFGGAVATSGGLVFIAATADEKIRAFEKQTGRVLWEYQLPAAGYATPSVYMVNGRQYVVIAAGGGGKNATKSGDSVIAFALPEEEPQISAAGNNRPADSGWIQLFDGKTLNGWVHMNGAHRITVEDGAIVGRTVESSASMNSFLCSLQEFDDFELELETYIDPVINSGIQIRTKVRPAAGTGPSFESAAGRVNGPQVEIRRHYKGLPTTGVLYGEALGTGWLSSQQKIEAGHEHYIPEDWNKLRIVAKGPRIQAYVNGHLIEDVTNEAVYKTHSKGFIGLQVHGLSDRELALPANAGMGISKGQSLVVKFRNIRVRPLSARN
jgi:quinoprotein glucose dehydrogenase